MGIFRIYREPTQDELERRELLDAIARTREDIDDARRNFSSVSEPELVDAAAYEIKALEARYSYLLRLAREEGCDAMSVFKTLR